MPAKVKIMILQFQKFVNASRGMPPPHTYISASSNGVAHLESSPRGKRKKSDKWIFYIKNFDLLLQKKFEIIEPNRRK